MKTVWIVRWRGLEETCTSLPEALDRRDQLDARGIATELFRGGGRAMAEDQLRLRSTRGGAAAQVSPFPACLPSLDRPVLRPVIFFAMPAQRRGGVMVLPSRRLGVQSRAGPCAEAAEAKFAPRGNHRDALAGRAAA